MTSPLRIVVTLLLVVTTSALAQGQTVLFDFEEDPAFDNFLHFGNPTLASSSFTGGLGYIADCGTPGNHCAWHSANFTEDPFSPNDFGIGEIGPFFAPTQIDLSGFIGYSIRARFIRTGVADPLKPLQTDFTGLSPIKFGLQWDTTDGCNGSSNACSDLYDTPVMLTETFQTFTVMFSDFMGANPTNAAQIKMLMLTGEVDLDSNPPVKFHSGDFNASSLVDGSDFLTWQLNNGADGAGLAIPFADGNANLDSNVDAADLAIWESQFGTNAPITDWSNGVGRLEFDDIIGILPPPLGASAVPEPASCALIILCGASLLARGARSKR